MQCRPGATVGERRLAGKAADWPGCTHAAQPTGPAKRGLRRRRGRLAHGIPHLCDEHLLLLHRPQLLDAPHVLGVQAEEGDVLQVPAVAVAGHDALQLRGHVGGDEGFELLLPPQGPVPHTADSPQGKGTSNETKHEALWIRNCHDGTGLRGSAHCMSSRTEEGSRGYARPAPHRTCSGGSTCAGTS
jgi:hypothetical protein